MTEPQWCIVAKDGPIVHIYARFVNEEAATKAALQMNWTPDREKVRVIKLDPPSQGTLL